MGQSGIPFELTCDTLQCNQKATTSIPEEDPKIISFSSSLWITEEKRSVRKANPDDLYLASCSDLLEEEDCLKSLAKNGQLNRDRLSCQGTCRSCLHLNEWAPININGRGNTIDLYETVHRLSGSVNLDENIRS